MRSTQREMFFITGVSRSGTTLLRMLLNTHSQIAVPYESEFLMPLLNRKTLRGGLSESRLHAFIQYIQAYSLDERWKFDATPVYEKLGQSQPATLRKLISVLYGGYAHNRGKQIWGDKTPSFFRKLDILSGAFPEAKFIHIVRDGRDTFLSWRKLRPERDNAVVNAMEWRYKIRKVEKSFAAMLPGRNMTVRYEDLLAVPEQAMRGICSFLGVAYEPEMLQFHKSSDKFVPDWHSELIHQPIKKDNVSKWRDTLSGYEKGIFAILARDTLRRYGYPVDSEPFSPLHLPRLAGELLCGLPYRALQILRVKLALSSASKSGSKPSDIHKI